MANGLTPFGRRLVGVGTFVGLLAVTFAAGALGGIASASAPDFYEALLKPSWAPPPYVFGPVWTVLYALMASAAYLVVRRLGWRGAASLLVLYGVQLVANAAWTWLFFTWTLGFAAFIEILVLLILIVVMTWRFWRVRPAAGLLLVPYVAWVGFASALTWSVWQMNPGVL